MTRKPHTKAALCTCGGNLYPVFVWTHGTGSTGREHIKNFGWCRDCEKLFKISIVEVK